jgi:hypothetical protein
MTKSKHLTRQEITIGDAAVDGLLNGVVAGLVMAAYLVVIGLVTGDGPATVLSRFALSEAPSPLTSALMHLAVAGVYGILFGLGWRFTARVWRHKLPAWLWGLAYGLVLLLLAETVILRGTNLPLLESSTVHFALAHVIYGLTLGFLIDRREENHEP